MRDTNRLKGGLYGLLVGDALGVPYEFRPASAIPPVTLIEMTPPPGFRRAHATIEPGTWSDDGALALCLLASLLEKNKLDLPDLAAKFLAWEGEGYLAVDELVFDIGSQTSHAFQNLKRGMPADKAGPDGIRDNGNGSLMRVLPLALWHRGSDAELVELAHVQSLVTHGQLHAQACCALYVLTARRLLQGQYMADAWQCAQEDLAALYRDRPPYAQALEFILSAKSSEPNGSGYVVDSLWSAKCACAESSYERVVRAAIALGNDTDTTACIAGGLAGIHFGFDGIPPRWIGSLRGKELLSPLEHGLLAAALH